MPSQLLTTHRRTCMRPAEDQEDYSADFTFPSQEWASVPGWIGPGEGLGKQVAAAWWRAARLPKSSLRARIYVRNVSRGKSLNPTKSNLWGDLAMGPPRALTLIRGAIQSRRLPGASAGLPQAILTGLAGTPGP